jgi:hypothetical protein
MSIKVMCFVGARTATKIFIGEGGQEGEVFVNFNLAIGWATVSNRRKIALVLKKSLSWCLRLRLVDKRGSLVR